MRHILYILFIVSLLLGNDELNKYLNNQKLQHQIIKDEKNQRIIVDLLYDESRMIIFSKNQNKDYQKVFDEKLYFCEDNSRMTFSNVEIFNNQLVVICTITNVAPNTNFIAKYYFNLLESHVLTEVIKSYYNIEGDSITSEHHFVPQLNIPTLYNFQDEDFANEYLHKNYKNFVKLDNAQQQIQPTKQPLYKSPTIDSKTKMYLIKGDKVEILEEKDNWLHIFYKGKKEIKAWIPKDAVETAE
jgi:hypothetical protein